MKQWYKIDKIFCQQEIENLGLELKAPCINTSEAYFSVVDGKIFYALGALKNIGVGAVDQLATEINNFFA